MLITLRAAPGGIKNSRTFAAYPNEPNLTRSQAQGRRTLSLNIPRNFVL